MAQAEEYLPSKREALSTTASTTKKKKKANSWKARKWMMVSTKLHCYLKEVRAEINIQGG
jgi:hypothetical protein